MSLETIDVPSHTFFRRLETRDIYIVTVDYHVDEPYYLWKNHSHGFRHPVKVFDSREKAELYLTSFMGLDEETFLKPFIAHRLDVSPNEIQSIESQNIFDPDDTSLFLCKTVKTSVHVNERHDCSLPYIFEFYIEYWRVY